MARETHKVIDSKLRDHFSQPVAIPVPAVLREGSGSGSTKGSSSSNDTGTSDEIELKERRRTDHTE